MRIKKTNLIVIVVLTVITFITLSMCIKGFISRGNNGEKEVISNISSQVNEEEVSRVSIVAVGDNLLHIDVVKDSKTKDGGYDFKPIYENIKEAITSADIAMINQETILGGAKLGYSGYPNFNSPQEVGKNLVELGFDVINHANNHAMDKGIKGINNTLEFWKSYPNTIVTGIYGSYEDRQKIRVIDKNGIKIAFLSYTYGTNGIPIPKDKPYSVNLIDKTLISSDVKRAKEISDAIVVSMHWGNEYQTIPNKTQKDLAGFIADLGVNLVIGHHPHVLQPVELLKGKNGNETLVAYSLGNLISAQDKTPRLLGGLLNVVIEKGKDGNISMKELSMVPLVSHYNSGCKGFKIYPIDKYSKELAQKHGISKSGKALNIEEFNKITVPIFKSILDTQKTLEVFNNSNNPGTSLGNKSNGETNISSNVHIKEINYTKISNRLDEIAKKYKAVGMSVAVVIDGKIEWTKSIGMSDREKKIPVTDETVYRIASLSKTISNMVAMTLVDQGKLNLEGNIGDYLGFNIINPNYPKIPITLKSIMTHTSSISDNGTYASIINSGKGNPPLKNMFTPGSGAYSKNNFYKFQPGGESFVYSNLGAGIMGAVIEAVSTKKLNEYAKEALFEPMELDAGFLINDISDINKVANLYMGGGLNLDRNKVINHKNLYTRLPIGQNFRLSNANLYISAKDLAKLMIVLMNDGMYENKRILSKNSVDLMEKIHWSGNCGFHKLQGLNLHITDDLVVGRRLYGHQGRAYGALAEMFYDPMDKTGVVFITNGAADIKGENGFTSIGSDSINAVYGELD